MIGIVKEEGSGELRKLLWTKVSPNPFKKL